MKQTEIVKRAFRLTLRYPVLWIFGILVASRRRGWPSNSNYRLDRGGGRAPCPRYQHREREPRRMGGDCRRRMLPSAGHSVVTILLQYVSARRSTAWWTGSRRPAKSPPGGVGSVSAGATVPSACSCWS